MCMSGEMGIVREAIFASVGQLVIDGHGWPGARLGKDWEMGALLGVDGRQLDVRVLMLGCCRGRTEEFTSVIARHLGGPTAFVGCTGQPRTSEGPIVFPPLLIAAAPLVAAGGNAIRVGGGHRGGIGQACRRALQKFRPAEVRLGRSDTFPGRVIGPLGLLAGAAGLGR